MNVAGDPLTPADISNLAACSISAELAEQAFVRRVDCAEGARLVGRNGSGDYAGVLFPYVWPGDNHVREYRLRRDHPELEYKADGTTKEKAKYLSPPGRGNMLYFAPGTPPEWLKDPLLPLVITEGEKKVLALFGLCWHGLSDGAEAPRYLAVGLSGVWNFRGTVGKEPGPSGERRNVKGLIDDFARLTWSRRKVVIAYDANVVDNNSVQTARKVLTDELTKRGALVHWLMWPRNVAESINGIDDFIGQQGPEAALKLIEAARAWKSCKAMRDRWTASDLRAATFAKPKPIIHGVIDERDTIALVGKPKAGKSRLSMMAAIAVTRGVDFLGHRVPSPRRVVMLDLENRPSGVQSRLMKMMPKPSEHDDNLIIYAPETLADNTLTLASKEGEQRLREIVERDKPDLLIIDNWRLFIGGDENKSEVVIRCLKQMSGLRTVRSNLAIIIVHHLRKEGRAKGDNVPRLRFEPGAWVENASGHYALVSHVEACLGLEREFDKGNEEELIVFGGVARNYTPPVLLLEDDTETLYFRLADAGDVTAKLLTAKERNAWGAVKDLRRFSETEAANEAARVDVSRKVVRSMLNKLKGAGLLRRGIDKTYEVVERGADVV